jgi:hypothetical protein
MEEVEIIVRWMSGESTTVMVEANSGWWSAKRKVIVERGLEISPHFLRLMRPTEDGEWTEVCGAVVAGVYDGVVMSRRDERIEFIYCREDATLWRFEWSEDGYRKVELVMSLYDLESGAKGYVTQWVYSQAKKAGEAIPWGTIESILEHRRVPDTARSALLQLVVEGNI